MADNTYREMCRCVDCKRWQSTDGKNTTCGGCGGDLEIVNMDEHYKTLPRAPYDPTKDPKK